MLGTCECSNLPFFTDRCILISKNHISLLCPAFSASDEVAAKHQRTKHEPEKFPGQLNVGLFGLHFFGNGGSTHGNPVQESGEQLYAPNGNDYEPRNSEPPEGLPEKGK